MKLFVVMLRYLVPIEAIDACRPAHLKFLDRYFAEKIFIVSGPQNPRNGGIIMARVKNRGTLEKILHQDPFFTEQLAEYAIYEFCPNKFCPEAEFLNMSP